MTAGLLTALGVLVIASGFGVWWRRRDGRLRGGSREVVPDLAVPGARVTLLQFSSAFCAPCRATRLVLADVAARFDGVAHVELDAESRLDDVRRLNVWRTPTVFVLDQQGGIVHRASGTPSKAQVIAAIADLLPAGAAQ